MKSKKFKAFTLPEVLIAMVVVGVVSLLVIPALIKNINAKSNMSKLRTVVTDLSNAVEKEIVASRSDVFENTDIYQRPQDFLNNSFEHASSGAAFANAYTTKSGGNAQAYVPEISVLLKNGAGLGIINDDDNEHTLVAIDVNGVDKPNVLGVDYYVLFIEWRNDYDNAVHMGSVGSRFVEDANALTNAQLKEKCLSGEISDVEYCYRLAVNTGFDPEYLDKDY